MSTEIIMNFNIYPFLTPKGPYIRECDNIYPGTYFIKGIKLSH